MEMSMTMTFTNSYIGVPILFEKWKANNAMEFAGSLVIIVLTGVTIKLLLLLKEYLNERHWSIQVVITH